MKPLRPPTIDTRMAAARRDIEWLKKRVTSSPIPRANAGGLTIANYPYPNEFTIDADIVTLGIGASDPGPAITTNRPDLFAISSASAGPYPLKCDPPHYATEHPGPYTHTAAYGIVIRADGVYRATASFWPFDNLVAEHFPMTFAIGWRPAGSGVGVTWNDVGQYTNRFSAETSHPVGWTVTPQGWVPHHLWSAFNFQATFDLELALTLTKAGGAQYPIRGFWGIEVIQLGAYNAGIPNLAEFA